MEHRTSPIISKRSIYANEQNPYSPSVVRDLLQGTNEWVNIQDIVKLTFKALFDVIKAQGEAIDELERAIPTKVSKLELNEGLATKSNITDITSTLAEVANTIESKVSCEDLHSLLEDKVSKSDLQLILSNKVSIEEFNNKLDLKINQRDFKEEMKSLYETQDDFYKGINFKMAEMTSIKEIENINSILAQKANILEVNELLESKANKQSVANALHRKANRADIDLLLANKADLSEVQKINNILDDKLEKFSLNEIQEKISWIPKGEALLNQKPDKSWIEQMLVLYKNENESRFEQIEKHINSTMKTIHEKINTFNENLIQVTTKKADNEEMLNLARLFEKKVDINELEKKINDNTKFYDEMFNKLKSEDLQRSKVVELGLEDFRNKTDQKIEKALSESKKIKENIKLLLEDKKKESSESAKLLKNSNEIIRNEVDFEIKTLSQQLSEHKKLVEEICKNKLDKREFSEFKSNTNLSLEGKTELSEVQTAVTEIQKDIAQRISEVREELSKLLSSNISRFNEELRTKISIQELQSSLSTKADINTLSSYLKSARESTDLISIKDDIYQIKKICDSKVELKEYEIQINLINDYIDGIKKTLLLKSNINDVCTLIDQKANLDEVNEKFIEIQKEIEKRGKIEDINSAFNEQALINESLCSENVVGRWTWKSKIIKNGFAIPWESQTINTFPDNFLWEKDKTSILVVAGGLYEISFGFFAKKRPNIQLLVNGEPVLSASNFSSASVSQSYKPNLLTTSLIGGIIAGITLIDYLLLPTRARISISYNGDPDAEGFIGIRKL